MKIANICGLAALVAASTVPSATLLAQELYIVPNAAGSVTTTTVTNVTGSITQWNYGSNGAVEGFLVGTNVLLDFPMPVAAGIASLGAVGNSVTYSGTAVTSASGFQSVRVTSFTNNNTKATYSSSTTPATPATYGPTSGVIKQLNYEEDGAVDGFLFTPSGSTTPILVTTPLVTNTALKAALTVNATITVSGTTRTPMLAGTCVATGALTVVDATSIAAGGTTYVLTGGNGNGNGNGPGRGGRH